METLAFGLVSVAYFLAWNYLRPLESSRYQHIAAYAGGLISIVLALKAFFPEFDLYASLLIAYIGMIFM